MLHLIKMWLQAPVEETDARGHKRYSTAHRDQRCGTPQGSPISPLLANLYMRRFIREWKRRGLASPLGEIVTYADDLVICCRNGRAQAALTMTRHLMGKLGLTVNEEKTHIRHIPDETFGFLGYNFGRFYSTQTGRPYIGTRPSATSIQRLIDSIHAQTAARTLWLDATQVVEQLNRSLVGWANYFMLGRVARPYKRIDLYTKARLRRWLCRKHKVSGRGFKRYPDQYLYERLALVRLPVMTHRLPWAKA
jgi:hypothetical protein